MKHPFTFELDSFEFEQSGHESGDPEILEYPFDKRTEEWEGYAGELIGELSVAELSIAIQRNRRYARQLGWGCVVGGRIDPIPEVRTELGLPGSPGAEDIARAVERWQTTNLRRSGDGQLGPATWGIMKRKILPQFSFKPASWTVTHEGQRLGVIEKTAVYGRHQSATQGGVEIQLGFRVADEDAVRKAGFVGAGGEPRFRWVQIVELRRIGGPAEPDIQQLRKRGQGRIIDPTSALLPLDAHPYYWYETLPAGIPAGFHISNYLNRQAPNRLCYDLLFYDRPSIPFSSALPGRRAYFNFETALVGIREPHKNVILNTVMWGFDLMLVDGTPTLRVNTLRAGPHGGSSGLKRVISREIAAGSFPGHCFAGGQFTAVARCA